MKIELIIPSNSYLGDEKRSAPLGIMYLASFIESRGYNIVLNDLRGVKEKDFSNHIGNANIYGVTATTPDYPTSKKIAEICKEKNPGSWTIIGGIHSTSVPGRIDNIFDKVVIGEGENSLLNIIKDFDRKNNERRFYSSALIKNLDELPYPARHKLPFSSIFSKNALFSESGSYATTIISSRGCPNNCSFCASEKMWTRKVRFRSSENVADEMKEIIKNYGVRDFRFQDDTMTINRSRLEKLCYEIEKLEVRWRVGTRVDSIDREILKIMKKAGCEEQAFGIESLNQDVLDRNNKRTSLEEIYKAMEYSKEAGMLTRLYFIIGLPGEKRGFARRLEEFAEKYKPDAINIHTFVPFPGSDVYENPEKYGIELKEKNFSSYVMAVGLKEDELNEDFVFKHDIMSEEELKQERKEAIEFVKNRKLVKNL